jgi:uncharacterized membrane protein YgdD (TMEM256/DUF423 family)
LTEYKIFDWICFSPLASRMNVTANNFAIISGFSSVLLGAFGAHSLFANNPLSRQAQIYQTGINYQMAHSLLILVNQHKNWSLGNRFTAAGIVLFSGSLYFLAISAPENSLRKLAGPLTPLGGLCFLAGWILNLK